MFYRSKLTLAFLYIFILNIEFVHGAETVDRIVSVVDDDLITLYDLNKAIKPYEDRIKALGYPYEREVQMLNKTREDILNQLIDQKLKDQEIKKSNITVSEKEIDSAVERLKETNSITDEQFKEGLSQEGFTMESYRNNLKEQLLRMKLVNLKVKSKAVIIKDELKAYYNSHKEEFGGAKKYHLRNILLRIGNFADDKEKQTIYRKMESIIEKFKKGESFESLAKIYSESSLASEGGDLGLFKLEELSQVVQEKIKNLKPNQITDIILTDQGYQLFLLQDISETIGKNFDDAQNEIEQKLYQEIVDKKFQEWIAELKKKSHIKILTN